MAQSTEQKRAKHAFEAVLNAKKLGKGKDDYANQAKKMPVRIISAGLGQALAFILAKDNAEELLRYLSDWVMNKPDNYTPNQRPQKMKMIEEIIAGDSEKLRYYTNESLAYLQWLNRFASASELKG